jgi:galactokinase
MSAYLAAFLELVERLPRAADARLAQLLEPATELFIARAPARLDVMGGFADYSGSLTLEMPLAEATFAAVQPSNTRQVRIASLALAGTAPPRHACLSLSELAEHAASYASARSYFASRPEGAWLAYIAGNLSALQQECGVRLEHGLNVLVASSVPEGMGVSSSAAVEVACLKALCAAHGKELGAVELALACQRVENLVVGAPCGVMDQMTASAGLEAHLLELLCQPAAIQGSAALPAGLSVWGVDSGLRHQVSGADYTEVRVAAFMGYRIVAERAGLRSEPAGPGRVKVEDERWGGYLANLEPRAFEEEFARALPERMSGAEFLARYGGITDAVTRVSPDTTYRIRAASAHPVYENRRAARFRELLRAGIARSNLEQLGELMYGAHQSYSDCGLGSSGTDLIVQLVRELGPERGFFGAKITGGGSGGTVAVLTQAGAEQPMQVLLDRYAARTGHQPYLFQGSSPGADRFGVHKTRTAAARAKPA